MRSGLITVRKGCFPGNCFMDGGSYGMSSASVKILALLVFNLAVLGASLYLLTFSPTTALPIIGNIRGGLPFASFVKDGGG